MQRRDAVQNQRKVGQDSRQSEQNTRESSQDLREAGQDSRQSEQNTRDASQDLREASQEFQISGHALLDLEARYQLLVDSVTDYAIYMLDPEGRVATWNLGAERLKGYKAEEVLGQNYSIVFLPEDAAAGLPARELAITAREGRFETQAWRRRKDGTKFWALVTMTAIRDPNGELHGFAKVTRDLSVQKAAEEATRQFSKRIAQYQFIVENIGEFVLYTLDAEGRFTSWGSALEKSTGYTAAEMLGQEYSLCSTEEDRQAGVPGRELEEAARTGRCASDVWRASKDGSLIWATGVIASLRGDDGKLTGFLYVGRDMTRQKRVEEALIHLNAQLERYRIIVENITDHLIYTMDAEGRIDSWTAGSQALAGFAPEFALGRDYAISFLPEDVAAGRPRQELEEAARSGHCIAEGWRRRSDESIFWSSGSLTAVRNESGEMTGYIRVARDMTVQKRLEESLARMAADLERRVAARTHELEETVAELQRKNQEVEAFVHIVSHDLRAPLVNVQGFVRELEESSKTLRMVIQSCPRWEECWPGVRPVLEDEIGGALHYISASTTKFERLINALLGLSRQGRQVYHMTRVNVWELVTNSVATFQQLIAEAGAEVDIGQLPSVNADITALGQVFSNLIGNALKYRCPERPLRIEIGGQAEEDKVHYWVRDNGLGIPEYGIKKLFQVFQRFHRKQAEGEGMGLAIAHRIVERHGGKIWAESREGEGSAFHFTLPSTPVETPTIAQEANRP
jgi:PAS domain S-box-containing protein